MDQEERKSNRLSPALSSPCFCFLPPSGHHTHLTLSSSLSSPLSKKNAEGNEHRKIFSPRIYPAIKTKWGGLSRYL
ncbi:hypothetical protein BT93_L1097 [Corymbia citriodora subsp. variegata]|uniref:Uncharacterized protein n=1 Tax=Corymbia citriodora subsp. variegata TaxID=360336 RepID=A0A8T0CNJ4_CORYI|nr:hypothetical protein BT93_L1097 [Corymbia citriodora subsp. variegata]